MGLCHNEVGPDYFGFYAHEVADLLSHDEDFLPFSSRTSHTAGRTCEIMKDKDTMMHLENGKEVNKFNGSGSLFCSGVGAGLSDYKKERLKALLRQSLSVLTQEVDEMLDPVVAICRIQSCIRGKKGLLNCSAVACDDDVEQHPHKKLKLSSSTSPISSPLHCSHFGVRAHEKDTGYEHMDVALPGQGVSVDVEKQSAKFHKTETSNWETGSEEPEANDDLQFLLENDGSKVEETMKKYSDELFATLGHMEQKLEELLDTVTSSCRLMTLAEKQQLRKLIQKLPPKNLDRIVEIMKRNKPPGKYCCDEIHVNLEKEDNVTLWRLYYYVGAVENARKLLM